MLPVMPVVLALIWLVTVQNEISFVESRLISSQSLQKHSNQPRTVYFEPNSLLLAKKSKLKSNSKKEGKIKTKAKDEINFNLVDKPLSYLSHRLNDNTKPRNDYNCSLPESLIKEIQGYSNISNLIINTVKDGIFKGKTYNDLERFVDRFGSRVSGSANLEKSIDYMMQYMKDRHLNVYAEEALVPNWLRGKEEAYMIMPRKKSISLLGLGFSVGTPTEGITAEVLVVQSFDELRANAKKAVGKIIVFNEDYVSYGQTVKYRGSGAVEAAKVGGVAALIRSVTPFSLYTPHAGMMSYAPNVTQIPGACITVEDAELLYRLQSQGQTIVITLIMNDFNLPLKTSRNVIGEIPGKEKPDEFIVVSGHIDSWDVGQGAMDDGGGMIISAQALALINFLNLKPRRTLRAILWTAEEFGLWGVQSYVEKHKNELDKFKAVFESDIGTFKPLGLDFAGSDEAGCIVQEVLKLLAPINATKFRAQDDVGSDIYYFLAQNVPGLSLNNQNENYFDFHHSQADTMTVENSDDLDLCVAVWATASYVLADLSVELPRKVSA